MAAPERDEARGQAGSGEAGQATNDTGNPTVATPTPQGRADLKPHKLALRIPEMLRDEYVGLVADIEAHGLRLPIVLFDGKILDGRHRYNACRELGIEAKVENFTGTEVEAWSFVQSINAHRRHLTLEQKRDLIAKLLKVTPEKSNRAIGKTVNVDHKTVAAVRSESESTGEIPQLDKTVGADGKARPATKPKTVKVAIVKENRPPKVINATITKTQPKPVDLLREFKRFALRYLDPLPINERTDMARRWRAFLDAT